MLERLLGFCRVLVQRVIDWLWGSKAEERVVALGLVSRGSAGCELADLVWEGRGLLGVVVVFLLLGLFVLVAGVCVRSLALA